MGVKYLDSPEALEHAIRYWKSFSLRKTALNLDETIKTIGTEDQVVEAVQEWGGRWVVS